MKLTKKLIVSLIFSLALSGCIGLTGGNKSIEPSVEVYVADFTKHPSLGIYPGDYTGAFQAKGQIVVEVWGGITFDPEDPWAAPVITPVTSEEALRLANEKTKALGGDAISQFRLESLDREVPVKGSAAAKVPGFRISGFVILRADAPATSKVMFGQLFKKKSIIGSVGLFLGR